VYGMPRSLRVQIKPAVFKWLRESSGWSIEDVSRRLQTSADTIRLIESGAREPTLNQLRELSNAYKRPIAIFLLSDPLKESPLPKDYRMLPNKKDVFEKRTLEIIRRARALQDVGAELLINTNESVVPKINRVTLTENPETLARRQRDEYQLSVEVQNKFRDSYQLYNHLRESLEDRNILVFQFSMSLNDARGFALTDKNPNVIVINSTDTVEARIFSLVHELGHILLGQTVIDLPDINTEIIINVRNDVENWCNSFASEFLLPKEQAKLIFDSEETALTSTDMLNKFSRRFKVSKGMIIYKMFKLGFISKSAYEEILKRYQPSEVKVKKDNKDKGKKGGALSADIKCLSEVGNKFVSVVANNYDHNFITFTDALNYLSVRSKVFDRVLARAKQ
jgi:Zn-dependent peptidase ImmA (M78 family)